MAYELVFTDSSKQQIKSLDKVIQKRVRVKLEQAALLSDISLVSKRLSGTLSMYWRLRVGTYRVIFRVDGKKLVILHVQHRKDVYR